MAGQNAAQAPTAIAMKKHGPEAPVEIGDALRDVDAGPFAQKAMGGKKARAAPMMGAHSLAVEKARYG